jgi:hypothetical protein
MYCVQYRSDVFVDYYFSWIRHLLVQDTHGLFLNGLIQRNSMVADNKRVLMKEVVRDPSTANQRNNHSYLVGCWIKFITVLVHNPQQEFWAVIMDAFYKIV